VVEETEPSELSILQEQMAAVQQELKLKKDDLNRLYEKKDMLERIIQNTKEENYQLGQRIHILEQQREEESAAHKKTQEQQQLCIQNTVHEGEQAQTTISTLREQLSLMESKQRELEQAHQGKAADAATAAAAEAQLGQAQRELSEYQAQVEALRSQAEAAEARAGEAERAMERAQQQASEAREEAEVAAGEGEAELEGCNAELEGQKEQRRNLEKILGEFENEVSRLTALQDVLKQKESDNDNLVVKYALEKDQKAKLEKDVRRLQGQVREAEAKLEQMNEVRPVLPLVVGAVNQTFHRAYAEARVQAGVVQARAGEVVQHPVAKQVVEGGKAAYQHAARACSIAVEAAQPHYDAHLRPRVDPVLDQVRAHVQAHWADQVEPQVRSLWAQIADLAAKTAAGARAGFSRANAGAVDHLKSAGFYPQFVADNAEEVVRALWISTGIFLFWLLLPLIWFLVVTLPLRVMWFAVSFAFRTVFAVVFFVVRLPFLVLLLFWRLVAGGKGGKKKSSSKKKSNKKKQKKH